MKTYGYIYDKKGNLKEVTKPLVIKQHINGTIVEFPLEKRKIQTGKIPANVGFSKVR